jgi:hypothetical protein
VRIEPNTPCFSCGQVQNTIATKDKLDLDASYQPMVWKGGPIIGWPEVVALYWGGFTAAQVSSMQSWLASYAGYLSGNGAPPGQTCVLSQYGIGGGTVGSHHQEATAPAKANEGDVQHLIQTLQGQGNLPAFSANRLFLVFTLGVSFDGYGTQWCGYHGSWGTGEYFAIVPYPSVGGCGNSTPDASWQSVTSHEIAEAATDPGGGSGWVVGTEEGGDTCAWQEDQLPFGTIQKFADNMEATCASWTAKGLLNWTLAGNTAGFGNTAGDPTWIGDFSGSGRSEVLFYSPGDHNWWLGSVSANGQLNWTLAGNTGGFGQVADGRPFWTGDFSGTGHTQIMFYYPGDHNWWLGTVSGTSLNWTLAGNTAGFGQVADGRPFWTGDFSGTGHTQIMFYYPGDHNWWLGTVSGTSLNWTLAGNTAGFGNTASDPTWIGDFTGSGKSEVMFYSSGDSHWWLGTDNGTTLQWPFAGNTRVFGANIVDGRPWWVGRFSRSDRDQMLFYYPGDGNWWLGSTDLSRNAACPASVRSARPHDHGNLACVYEGAGRDSGELRRRLRKLVKGSPVRAEVAGCWPWTAPRPRSRAD